MQKTDILKSLVNIISFLFLNGLVMIKASLHVEMFSDPDYIYTSETQSPKPKHKGRQLPIRMKTLRSRWKSITLYLHLDYLSASTTQPQPSASAGHTRGLVRTD